MRKRELIFKDNKNNKYILEVKDKGNLSEQYLKDEFKNQYDFDDKVINLYYNKQKNFDQEAEILSKGDLSIENIKHVKIDLGKTIIEKNNNEEMNRNLNINNLKISIFELNNKTQKVKIPNDISSINGSLDISNNSFFNESSFF